VENSSPNPSFSICDTRIQKQISRNFSKSFPKKEFYQNFVRISPATCMNTWKAEHHRKILFSLKEEKGGRAQNEKSKEYFSVVWRAYRAVAGLASSLEVLLKKCSNFVQKTRQERVFFYPKTKKSANIQSLFSFRPQHETNNFLTSH